MIDCMSSDMVGEPVMVVDGPDYVLVLPAHLAAVAEHIASLCSGIQTVGRAGEAEAEGVA